jgi:hypothetical protein
MLYPAPTTIIHVKPMTRTTKDRRRHMLDLAVTVAHEALSALALVTFVSAITTIALIIHH